MSIGQPESIPSAEFVRSFAIMRQKARIEPVYISNHGRNSHVLLSMEEFESIKHRLPETDESASDHEILAKHLDVTQRLVESVIAYDDDLRIVFANQNFANLSRRMMSDLYGATLNDVIPDFAGSLIAHHVNLTKLTNQATSAEVPSPFAEEGWLLMKSFTQGAGNVLTLLDISGQVKRSRIADAQLAILKAMEVDGFSGFVRLSPRATIDEVSNAFANLVGLSSDSLVGTSIIDLAALPHRSFLRSTLQSLLQSGEPQKLTTCLVSRDGELLDVVVSGVRLDGMYGTEGAIILVHPVADTRPAGAASDWSAGTQPNQFPEAGMANLAQSNG